jgi:hypothetical protein
MDGVSTSETLFRFYQTTLHSISEGSHVQNSASYPDVSDLIPIISLPDGDWLRAGVPDRAENVSLDTLSFM